MLFTQFSALGDQKTPYIPILLSQKAQKTRYVRGFLHVAPKTTVFTVFSAHGPSKTSVFPVFLQHFTLLSFNTKITKILYFTAFCALTFAKKCTKHGPKTVPEDRLSRPVIFWRISLVFWQFFDDFLTPPKIPKKRQNTSSMKDFSENSLFSKLEILKMQKRSEMQARASFFKATFKKHREGGGSAAPAAPQVAS